MFESCPQLVAHRYGRVSQILFGEVYPHLVRRAECVIGIGAINIIKKKK